MFKDCFDSFDQAFLTPVSLDVVHADCEKQMLAVKFLNNAYEAYLDAIHQEALDLLNQD